MYSAPKHAAARKRSPLRHRIIGIVSAATATFITGVTMSPIAHAENSVWDRVAACESNGNWGINSHNGYYGGIQFSAQTWRGFGGTRYAPNANRASKSAQITVAKRIVAVQGASAWPVCGRRAGLNGANAVSGTAVGDQVHVDQAYLDQVHVAEPVATVSRAMIRDSIAWSSFLGFGTLRTDGILGPMTTGAVQSWVGTSQDAVMGPATVKALQRKVGSQADGIIGPRTTRALEVTIGARPDGAGQLSAATVSALQRYLGGT